MIPEIPHVEGVLEEVTEVERWRAHDHVRFLLLVLQHEQGLPRLVELEATGRRKARCALCPHTLFDRDIPSGLVLHYCRIVHYLILSTHTTRTLATTTQRTAKMTTATTDATPPKTHCHFRRFQQTISYHYGLDSSSKNKM